MKHKTLLCLFALLMICLTACDKAPTTTPTMEKAAATPATIMPVLDAATAEQEIRQFINEWDDASKRNNKVWFEKHMTEKWIGTGTDNKVYDKKFMLGDHEDWSSTTELLLREDMKIVPYENTAVLAYRLTSKWTANNKSHSEVQRVTNTLVKQDGVWKIAAGQVNDIKPAK